MYMSRPALIVVNEDPDYMPGSHWMGIYIDCYGFAYFFDSFGRKPRKNILDFLKRNSTMWSYNYRVIQDVASSVCGHYCILFLLNYTLNNSVDKFLSLFKTRNPMNNDLICKKMFDYYFSRK